jgi:hypothetical protein
MAPPIAYEGRFVLVDVPVVQKNSKIRSARVLHLAYKPIREILDS